MVCNCEAASRMRHMQPCRICLLLSGPPAACELLTVLVAFNGRLQCKWGRVHIIESAAPMCLLHRVLHLSACSL